MNSSIFFSVAPLSRYKYLTVSIYDYVNKLGSSFLEVTCKEG